MRNLVEYMHVYRGSDNWFVIVETGMPADQVHIGVGVSIEEAYEDRDATPCQSVGRDSGVSAALDWAYGANWLADEIENLEYLADAVLYDDEEEEDDDD